MQSNIIIWVVSYNIQHCNPTFLLVSNSTPLASHLAFTPLVSQTCHTCKIEILINLEKKRKVYKTHEFFHNPMSFCSSYYHCNICGLNRTTKIELDLNNADVQIISMKNEVISMYICSTTPFKVVSNPIILYCGWVLLKNLQ